MARKQIPQFIQARSLRITSSVVSTMFSRGMLLAFILFGRSVRYYAFLLKYEQLIVQRLVNVMANLFYSKTSF